MPKGAELLVAALENEGVDRVFGIPGEENLDMVEALRQSSIELVLTRHEQAAAFMAATHGRLTGKPGVCLTTLGPGALNLTTGAAYAQLGAMPMIMITGQKGVLASRQARFQIVDVVAVMKPLTKLARQIVSPAMIPTIVREAFRVAAGGTAGAGPSRTARGHRGCRGRKIRPDPAPSGRTAARERSRPRPCGPAHPEGRAAAGDARRGGRRGRGRARELAEFVVRLQIPYFTTQMGKGTVPGGTELYMGTAALSERDYVHEAIERADLIITIGHDTVEKPPFIMGPNGPQVIHIGYQPASVEQVYFPQAEVIGDLGAFPAAAGRARGGKYPERAGAVAAPGGHPEPGSPRARRRTGSRPSGSCTMSARSCRRTGSSCPRQRHVQDLVRPQLPHEGRQYASARQRARDHGGGPAVGDHGGTALSGPPGHGGLR